MVAKRSFGILLIVLVFVSAHADKGRKQRQRQDAEVVKKICLQKRFYGYQYYLQCQADYEEGDSDKVCPIAFNCPTLDPPSTDTDRCHVNGRSYEPRQKVPNNNKCRECFCRGSNKKLGIPADVECSAIECPNVDPLPPPGFGKEDCFYIFDNADSCCPKRKCVPRRDNSTRPDDNEIVCEHDKIKYTDGQKIFPQQNPCKVCQCSSRYDGVDGPTCVDVECDMDIERERILKGCVPVYNQAQCCPTDWICPKEDVVDIIPKGAAADKCYFGGNAYDYGTGLENKHVPSSCIQCRCVAPNLFTCIEEVCPSPPRPKPGFQCIPKRVKPGQEVCCPQFDCNVRIVDPCERNRCTKEERCVRLLQSCRKPPCKDDAECVPKNFHPCEDVTCENSEICVARIIPCPARHCPETGVCLPINPCKENNPECKSGEVCKNIVKPCPVPPCPKVAQCVNADPCKDFLGCRANHVCKAVNEPGCKEEPCPKDPICSNPDCPRVRCSKSEIYQPFGQGKDNCPWCMERPRKVPRRRQPPPQRRQ